MVEARKIAEMSANLTKIYKYLADRSKRQVSLDDRQFHSLQRQIASITEMLNILAANGEKVSHDAERSGTMISSPSTVANVIMGEIKEASDDRHRDAVDKGEPRRVMTPASTSDLGPSGFPNLHFRWEYVRECHAYINSLNNATDNRAYIVVVVNSLLFTGALSAHPNLSFRGVHVDLSLALEVGIVFFLLSTLLSVWAINPRTLDSKSPIHISSISQKNLDEYTNRSLHLDPQDIVADFCRENLIVSKIIMAKRRYVAWSIKTLIIGVLATACTPLVTLLIHLR